MIDANNADEGQEWIAKENAKVQPARSVTIGPPVEPHRAPKPIGAELPQAALSQLTLPAQPPPPPPPPADIAPSPASVTDNSFLPGGPVIDRVAS